MITYNKNPDLVSRVYEYGQEHVFAFWDNLSSAERQTLMDDLESVDFPSLQSLYQSVDIHASTDSHYVPAPFIPRPSSESDAEEWNEMKSRGEFHIKNGSCAAFIVAGGQGSRLGFDGPKGVFKIGPVTGKSLFQIHTEKVLKSSQKYGVRIPLFIMTSQLNHAATEEHFQKNKFFGLDERDLFLFPQNMIPSLDTNGKLILSSKCSLFKNPDGHGGSLTALRTSGALDEMTNRGITTLSYIQVDNPLVNIIDPVFIGFHTANSAEVSSKALQKTSAEEKIGVFVQFRNGREGVIEYSDLPRDKMYHTNNDGSLSFSAGSIAIHLFERTFIGRITSGGETSLPFHVANKKIKTFTANGVQEIDGFKFEKFVFDSLPLASSSVILETIREEEFAPVKNATGDDSVSSSQLLMSNLYRSWCISRGIILPKKVRTLEISPLAAIDTEDLSDNLAIPNEEQVYVE